jgi:hypothetical protein
MDYVRYKYRYEHEKPCSFTNQIKLDGYFTLKRNEQQEQEDTGKTGRTELVVKNSSCEGSLERTNPEVVQHDETLVESVHVVRQQVHHLSDGRCT